jgi:hypothetical protein
MEYGAPHPSDEGVPVECFLFPEIRLPLLNFFSFDKCNPIQSYTQILYIFFVRNVPSDYHDKCIT